VSLYVSLSQHYLYALRRLDEAIKNDIARRKESAESFGYQGVHSQRLPSAVGGGVLYAERSFRWIAISTRE
jgi:hypothetical protein